MKITCDRVQEDIATETELCEAVRRHLVQCESCGRLYEEYRTLADLVQRSGASPPCGFADMVMDRIAACDIIETIPSKTHRWVEHVFSNRLSRVFAFGIGSALSIMSLVRFAFFVLIPT